MVSMLYLSSSSVDHRASSVVVRGRPSSSVSHLDRHASVNVIYCPSSSSAVRRPSFVVRRCRPSSVVRRCRPSSIYQAVCPFSRFVHRYKRPAAISVRILLYYLRYIVPLKRVAMQVIHNSFLPFRRVLRDVRLWTSNLDL